MKSDISILSIRSLLVVLALGATCLPGFAADNQPPTISVAKTVAPKITYWQPAMGEGLAQMMITELNKLDNMKVLESVALDDLREERRLGENGEVPSGEAVKKGQWKGADYTFKSVVTRFGAKESNYGGSGGGFLLRRLIMNTIKSAIAAGIPAKTAMISAMTIKSGPARLKKLAMCNII